MFWFYEIMSSRKITLVYHPYSFSLRASIQLWIKIQQLLEFIDSPSTVSSWRTFSNNYGRRNVIYLVSENSSLIVTFVFILRCLQISVIFFLNKWLLNIFKQYDVLWFRSDVTISNGHWFAEPKSKDTFRVCYEIEIIFDWI